MMLSSFQPTKQRSRGTVQRRILPAGKGTTRRSERVHRTCVCVLRILWRGTDADGAEKVSGADFGNICWKIIHRELGWVVWRRGKKERERANEVAPWTEGHGCYYLLILMPTLLWFCDQVEPGPNAGSVLFHFPFLQPSRSVFLFFTGFGLGDAGGGVNKGACFRCWNYILLIDAVFYGMEIGAVLCTRCASVVHRVPCKPCRLTWLDEAIQSCRERKGTGIVFFLAVCVFLRVCVSSVWLLCLRYLLPE